MGGGVEEPTSCIYGSGESSLALDGCNHHKSWWVAAAAS